MSVWSLSVCIHALHLTSSARAACCRPRTMCGLPGTKGRVLQGMVSIKVELEGRVLRGLLLSRLPLSSHR